MATMKDLANEIAKRTDLNTNDVMKVLKEIGDALIEVMKKEKGYSAEPRVHIPDLGAFKIEKDKRQKSGYKLVMYPAPYIKRYKIEEVKKAWGWQ